MKTLLISPPREAPIRADFPPIGLCYLSANLKKNHFLAGIIDASNYSWQKLAKEILEYLPDLVGITCWTIEREQAYKTALLVKKILPKAKIMMGGQHATAFPEQMFTKAMTDMVGIGECDETIVEIVHALSSGQNLKNVKGIVFKEKNKLIYTQPRPLKENLDELPFPDYSDFDFKNFNGLPETKRIAGAIITSRGCPYHCTFCSSSKFWQRRWHFRSAKNVLSEINYLYYKKGIRALLVFDDNFAVKKDRIIEICKGIIEKKLDLIWVGCTRINQVNDEEILTWLKNSGCYRIDFGVESGSLKILENIKKGITPKQIKKVFQMCHKIGIEPRANLMVGNPGETEETIEETVKLMKAINPFQTYTGQILWVLPDTEIYETAKSQGLMNDNWWLSHNEAPYYLGEYNLKQLEKLKSQLEFGLAKNEGTLIAYFRYLLLRLYFRFGFFRKLYGLALAYQKEIIQFLIKKDL